jgi:uncharacterized repeat protein (TIGR01451 family)
MQTETEVGGRISAARPTLAAAALIAIAAASLMFLSSPKGAGAAPGDADLALTKSDSPDPVAVGNPLTYTITVQNNGPMAATGATVTDALAASEVEFVSATASSGTCQHQANTVTCTLGTLNAGTTATATIVVRPKKAGTLSNTAQVASPEDNTPANNQETETTLVSKAPKKGKGKATCASPTLVGTAGDDALTGTTGHDVIVTFGGNDLVNAGDGKDLVCAGSGLDTVSGGTGGDLLIGGSDRDRLIGDDGNDVLRGKRGRDRLRGRAGADALNGGRGKDRCNGGPGADTFRSC